MVEGDQGGQGFVSFLLLGFSVWFKSVAAFVVVSCGYGQLENATATVGILMLLSDLSL